MLKSSMPHSLLISKGLENEQFKELKPKFEDQLLFSGPKNKFRLKIHAFRIRLLQAACNWTILLLPTLSLSLWIQGAGLNPVFL